jgi:hypothetical protein
MPEMWGIVQFSDTVAGKGDVPHRPPPDEDVRWALRRVYYAQRSYYRSHERYTADLGELGVDFAGPARSPYRLALALTAGGFEARGAGDGGAIWHIRQDGRIWSE